MLAKNPLSLHAGIGRPPWLALKRCWQLLRFAACGFMRKRGLENAKSLAFMSLFAAVPLLTLILIILSAFPFFQLFGDQVEGMILDYLLPSAGSEISGHLDEFIRQARNLTWLGLAMLAATAWLMLANVERSFNRIWEVKEPRRGLASLALHWSLLSLGPLLLGASFALNSYLASLTLFETLTEASHFIGTGNLALELFPAILTAFAFTLLYVIVPNCKVRLRHGCVGGLTVALLFMAAERGFTRLIALSSYELVYGAFAVIPVLLLWLYACWVIILFGANLVRAIPLFRADSEQP